MINLQRVGILFRLLFLGIFVYAPISYAIDSFIINHPESENDHRYQYTYDLLALIIEATQSDFGEASLQVSNVIMSRNRIFRSLQDGQVVNVMAEASSLQWDEQLTPIKIPIRKGIQGFRIFIIKKENLSILANINTLAQLTSLDTGSGSQWSTKIAMQQAGFNVIESTQYDNLFNMLSMGRFVTFGRGVNEVFQEVELFKQRYPDLVVDENILLHIPLATYYYVSPNEPRLAQRIQVGLKRIIANGQFDKLFYQRHCEFLLKSKFNERRIFKIDNPLISESEITSIVGKDFLVNPKDDFSALCEKYH
ncbi:hypothetical protein L2744_15585 [Shewanella profunda]|uniref:hypothetical protein n=1 Tax=Shewanella profunda TaxID=254793 RepID=UPI00200BE17B|nr:hypothetical protein [Shewanella profunda]MCL1090995.1 hypothetical protein [Shewanella profunda]